MTYLLACLAALAGRVRVERVFRWAAPIVLLALVFSLRRSFWIGIAAAAPLTLALALGPRGRRFLLPAALIIATALWLTVSSGIAFDSQTPIGQRLQSLTPTRLAANTQDRYRLDERKNVLAELEESPLVGLGLGVPWRERYPLSFENPHARTYSHMAVLWFWMKLGVLGLIAYLGYLLTAIVLGIQLFRRHHDPRVRVAGAATAGGLIGLAVAETTGTWLGTDFRMTVLIGCVAGLLSVARADLRSSRAVQHDRGRAGRPRRRPATPVDDSSTSPPCRGAARARSRWGDRRTRRVRFREAARAPGARVRAPQPVVEPARHSPPE